MQTPQQNYWAHEYKLPNGLTLSGHSRARERTCFLIKELRIFLDAGIGCENITPQAILLTHSHYDHAGALPSLLRGFLTRPKVFLPIEVTNRVREYCFASYAMKVNDSKPTPPHYLHTPQECKAGEEFRDSLCHWVPTQAGCVVPLSGEKNGDLYVHTVKCYHTITSVGYVISERRLKLKEEYRGLPGHQLAQLRKDGVNINDVTQVFKLAYLLDSTHEVFTNTDQSELIFQCPVIITECSFLHGDMDVEAIKRGHMSWNYLRPIVESHPHITFILCHFSHRYKEAEIIEFFESASSSGSKPPNVIPWVDSFIASLPPPTPQPNQSKKQKKVINQQANKNSNNKSNNISNSKNSNNKSNNISNSNNQKNNNQEKSTEIQKNKEAIDDNNVNDCSNTSM